MFLSWGGTETRDSAYKLLDEPINASVVRNEFEALSRFTRK